MTKAPASVPAPTANRGFVLRQPGFALVKIEFDGCGDLYIRQGGDSILIGADSVEVFKRGMTWVRAAIINPAVP